MRISVLPLLALLALLVAAASPRAALAASAPDTATIPAGWTPMQPERLDAMRGGFDLPSGLAVSFGIERLVYVNGALVATASVRIADVSALSPAQARALAALNAGMVVDVGSGTVVAPAASGALVIQNMLDGQAISVLTSIDVGVGTLGLFQQANATHALQDALIRVAGGP